MSRCPPVPHPKLKLGFLGPVGAQCAGSLHHIPSRLALLLLGPDGDPCPCGVCREGGQWCLVLGWRLSELELWGSSGPINPFIASRASLSL